MKFVKGMFVTFFALALSGASASAQSAAWGGTWELQSSSQDHKPTMTFIQKAEGFYELDSGTSVYRFRCDGKPYPLIKSSTGKQVGDAVCNLLTSSTLDVTYHLPEQLPSNGHMQVSHDGRFLTYTLGSLDATGKTPPKVLTYTRLSGTTGLVGGWKNTEADSSRLLKITLTAREMTLDSPYAHQTVILPLSGAEAHPISEGVPGKGTETLQIDGAQMLRTTIRQADGVVKQAVFSLSADGNTITESGWLQQHPEQVVTYTYRRSR